MVRLPKKLEKDTIIDAIFEVRFISNTAAIANILPGLLFQRYQSEYKEIMPLGPSQLPSEIVEADVNLRNAHHYRLVGDQYSLHIGTHVASISCNRPYTGWANFSQKISDLLIFLEDTKLIDRVERFSVKYVNVIPAEVPTSLNGIKLGIHAGDFDLTERPLNLRAEISHGGFQNIVQVSTGISVTTTDKEQIDGILLDIDTICEGSWVNFWADVRGLLEEAHDTEKQIFFGLLEVDLTNSLGPQY